MIEELWVKICGVDKWPETEARVTSVFRFTGRGTKGRPIARANLTIRYRTLSGQECSGELRVTIVSPRYLAREGETFPIRYDPARPEQYWCGMPETARGALMLISWGAAILVVMLVATLLEQWLKR